MIDQSTGRKFRDIKNDLTDLILDILESTSDTKKPIWLCANMMREITKEKNLENLMHPDNSLENKLKIREELFEAEFDAENQTFNCGFPPLKKWMLNHIDAIDILEHMVAADNL